MYVKNAEKKQKKRLKTNKGLYFFMPKTAVRL